MPSKEAQDRARALLLDYLSPEQREAFQVLGHFDVAKTGSPRTLRMVLLGYPRFRVYRLSHDHFPVRLFTSEKQLVRSVPNWAYCIYSHGAAPQDDDLLSMKLLLEHDEPLFLRIAHRVSSASQVIAILGDDPDPLPRLR
jgi:hypothetical protein